MVVVEESSKRCLRQEVVGNEVVMCFAGGGEFYRGGEPQPQADSDASPSRIGASPAAGQPRPTSRDMARKRAMPRPFSVAQSPSPSDTREQERGHAISPVALVARY